VTSRETAELRGLVLQAFGLRRSAYLVDACRAIVDWHERRPLATLENDQAFEAARSALASAYPHRYEGGQP
jgi:hypothetical protein